MSTTTLPDKGPIGRTLFDFYADMDTFYTSSITWLNNVCSPIIACVRSKFRGPLEDRWHFGLLPSTESGAQDKYCSPICLRLRQNNSSVFNDNRRSFRNNLPAASTQTHVELKWHLCACPPSWRGQEHANSPPVHRPNTRPHKVYSPE